MAVSRGGKSSISTPWIERECMCNFWNFPVDKFQAQICQFWKSACILEMAVSRGEKSSISTPWRRKSIPICAISRTTSLLSSLFSSAWPCQQSLVKLSSNSRFHTQIWKCKNWLLSRIRLPIERKLAQFRSPVVEREYICNVGTSLQVPDFMLEYGNLKKKSASISETAANRHMVEPNELICNPLE